MYPFLCEGLNFHSSSKIKKFNILKHVGLLLGEIDLSELKSNLVKTKVQDKPLSICWNFT